MVLISFTLFNFINFELYKLSTLKPLSKNKYRTKFKQMRRIYTIFLILMAFQLPAQDFSGLKIMVNPGHGGHDGDDRFIPSTGFWESEGNLKKGLYLRDLLQGRGAEVVMSRTTNFTEDDLPLSQISGIANSNDVDIFHSIHSNAGNGKTNRFLVLYAGKDGTALIDGSKELSQMMLDVFDPAGTVWTASGLIFADWDFYNPSFHLGVLKGLEMPGTLTEGSFHDYIPESWRLTNDAYCHHEAVVIMRGMAKYFGEIGESEFGVIAGVARNPLEKPDYFYAPGTDDEKRPINNITVKIPTLGLEYKGDEGNNGYFFFDSIAPGTYTITCEADSFEFYQTEVTVEANQTSNLDVDMEFDNSIPPALNTYAPEDGAVDVALNQPITFHFSLPMNQESVQNAITIEPAIDVTYSWSENGKSIFINAVGGLTKAMEFTVNLTTDAKQLWGVSIPEPLTFKFTTEDRSNLRLESTYPAENQTELSTLLQFRLVFDAPLDEESAMQNIVIIDAAGNEVEKDKIVSENISNKGHYYFEPKGGLVANTQYRILIKGGLIDIIGTNFGEDKEIAFTTQVKPFAPGKVIVDYEDLSSFWDPDGSGSTTGTNPDLTLFGPSKVHYISPDQSGKITYFFIGDDGGLIREYTKLTPKVGSDPASQVGLWIYGDLSYNELEFWFYVPDNVIVPVATIDWAGWKFVSIPFTDIPDAGTNPKFHSVVIKQTPEGAKSGAIYCDDIQIVPDYSVNPTITSTKPTAGSNTIDKNAAIEIVFDQAMDTEATNNALTIEPALDVNIDWQTDNSKMLITPTNGFDEATDYTITVGTTARNMGMVNLESEFVLSFTTPAYSQAPVVVSTEPTGADELIGVGDAIKINFDMPMDKASIESAITFEPSVSFIVKLRNDDKTVSLYPLTEWGNNTEYAITISTAAKHIWGVGLATDYTFAVKTKDVTGISDITAPATIVKAIYPNPVKTTAFLSFNLLTDAQVSLKVFDATGKLVLSKTPENARAGENRIDLNVRYLQDGIYTWIFEAVSVNQNGNNIRKSGKFMKQ